MWRDKRPKPLDRLWAWATEPGAAEERSKRFAELARFAKRQARRAVKAEAKAAWLGRKVIYRKRYRAAKKKAEQGGVPQWEPYMANGRNANITDAAKAEVAIAVVVFGCYVTSLWRAVVIAQSSPTSYHGPNVNPGKAADVAGSRMTDYQHDVKRRRQGDPNLLESFGPDNAACLKYGQPITLAEGTFLEQLHDTHEHVAAA